MERLQSRLRTLARASLSLDGQERWGHPSSEDQARIDAAFVEIEEDRKRTRAALAALLTATRQSAPAEVSAWADAHTALLTAFIATTTDATARFVANNELGQWAELARGSLDYVDENVFYVNVDAAAYAACFGFGPLEPTSTIAARP